MYSKMDGDIHNFNNGSLWNSCNEHLHSSTLDLQNYMSSSREHHHGQDSNKNPLSMSMHSPYVLFNYSQELTQPQQHAHHQQHQVHGREQWQFSELHAAKAKLNTESPFSVSKQSLSRSSRTQHHPVVLLSAGEIVCDHNMPAQIPSSGFFQSYSQSQDNFIQGNQDLHQQEQNNFSDPNSNNNSSANDSKVTESRRMKRKNPAPKKRKETKIKDGEKKKRIRNEEAWARNRRKKARAKGESYVSVVGKTVPARSVKPVDCSKCKFDCASHISEDSRQKLFKMYWGLETFKDKVDYICESVQEFVPLRPVSGKRAFSRRYNIKVNDKKIRVCKEFFLSTFAISESTIMTYLNKKRKNPEMIQDLRGKRAPSNKTPDSILRNVREHILCQIGLQGKLNKLPGDDSKNVKMLYSSYHAECTQDNMKPASISIYRKVFSDLHKGKCEKPINLPPEALEILNPGPRNSSKGTSLCASSTSPLQSPCSSAVDCEVSCDSEANSDSLTLPLTAAHDSHSLFNVSPSPIAWSCNYNITDVMKNSQMDCSGPEVSISGSDFRLPSRQLSHYHSPALPKSQIEMQCATFHQTSPQDNGYNSILPKLSDGESHISPSTSNHERDLSNVRKCIPVSETFKQHSNLSFINPSSSQVTCPNGNFGFSASANVPNVLPERLSISDANTSQYTTKFNSPQNHTEKICNKQKSENSFSYRKKSSGIEKSRREDSLKSKLGVVIKKRRRNEESWARNVRKRLRSKGEEYTSVTGKKVEAKKVLPVDCSKCKFKCLSKMTEKQREEINALYWRSDTFEEKVNFITKHVQTYKPKRRSTGRRSFSRKYVFEVDEKEVQVCKDFFQATLNLGESTISTALDKSRKGPESIVDLRGKHRPVNKTSDETLRNICELIIYVTGLRPQRRHENQASEHKVVHLYQVYKYDCQMKGNKAASLGVFRSVLLKEFGLSGSSNMAKVQKPKKDYDISVRQSVETSQQVSNSLA